MSCLAWKSPVFVRCRKKRVKINMKESHENGTDSEGKEDLREMLRTYELWLFLSHFCLRAAVLDWLPPVIPVSKTTQWRDSSFSRCFQFLHFFFNISLETMCYVKMQNKIKVSNMTYSTVYFNIYLFLLLLASLLD